ncbi:MAG: DUF4392 domain-containing protein [Planctomycetota bacterium]|nr:DUF4392 domain-containing protein [Planctomycetota bacterium]
MHVDAARRGLLAVRAGSKSAEPLCAGHLLGAAQRLMNAGRVAIVTGFFVPRGDVSAAETDGPLGAIVLAAILRSIGIETFLVTDSLCAAAIRVAGEIAGVEARSIIQAPDDVDADWIDEFFDRLVPRLTDLVSIERVGPSHTLESMQAQHRDGEAPRAEFEQLTEAANRGCTFNMRGHVLDSYSAPLYRLFENAPASRTIRTIGIGDGGNEIGMGTIPWEVIVDRIGSDPGARIACRVATDWNIIAGTSNWGAQALAITTSLLADRPELIEQWSSERQRDALQRLVSDGPCVDGITGKQEATVDGLSFEDFISAWNQMAYVSLGGA